MMNSLLPRLALCSVLLALPAQAHAAPRAGGIVDAAAGILTHPLAASILLALGFRGTAMQLKAPAAWTAGLTWIALVGGANPRTVEFADWQLIVLLALGLVLLAVEAFVLPGFGVAGVAGVAAVIASLLFWLQGPIPLTMSLVSVGAPLLLVFVLLGIGLWRFLVNLPRNGNARLHSSTRRDDGYVASTARLDLVGVDGVALTDLHPSGAARFGEERVDVISEGSFIPAGTPVRVVRAEGYRHVVRAV
jgi:membrane-bound serine protease (ClpP class)